MVRKQHTLFLPYQTEIMQKVRKILRSQEQKQGRCGGSQRISFRSRVKMGVQILQEIFSLKQTITVFLDENNKSEPSPTAETKPGLNL